MARLLIDTHLFLWWIAGSRRLTKSVRLQMENASEIYVSSASIWEAAIKKQLKKLDVDIEKLVQAISTSGFMELPITANHALAVASLADIHRDPFDRILIAQAISEPLIFLTADAALAAYSDVVHVV